MTNSKKETTELSGIVERVFFAGSGWSSGKIVADDGRNHSVAGNCLLREGDRVTLTGHFTTDPKWGRQFAVESFKLSLPVDRNGIVTYIANHPDIQQIGAKRALKLVDRFGDRWEEALENDAERMAAEISVKPATIENLRKQWQKSAHYNETASWLAAFGLTHRQITILIERHGNAIVAILEENPYRLIEEIAGYGFKRIDGIALKMGFPKDLPTRLEAGVLQIVNDQVKLGGHTWIERNALVAKAVKILFLDTLDAEEKIGMAIDTLIEKGVLVEEIVGIKELIASKKEWQAERAILDFLSQTKTLSPAFQPNEIAPWLSATLNEGQRAAALLACTHRASVITGGAGTGKTYTLNAICETFEQHEKTICLAAPTGKAAQRMEESTGRRAQTIHRLLKYNGRSFNISAQIEADLLVVDEISMVDTRLFSALVEWIDPTKTTLILVGDENQLPPVGAGNVLRDIIRHSLLPVARLTTVVRQAGMLKRNSMAILDGIVRSTDGETTETGLKTWQVVNTLKTPFDVIDFLTVLYTDILSEKYGLDLIRDVVVLSPQRKGEIGIVQLNLLLQRIVQAKVFGVHVRPLKGKERAHFYKGDKVIQRRNNYDLGVMNGTLGIVEEITPKGDITVSFDGNIVTLKKSLGRTSDIDLAYALTIHQTQGSEFDVALVVCHKAHSFMHHRNLLYTGVTRAKNSCAILGDHWGIRNCAKEIETNLRRTWLDALAKKEKKQKQAMKISRSETDTWDDIPL